jgi:hypothetical protein
LTAGGFKGFKGKEKICRDLGDRNLVDFSREIATVKILPAGQALLKMRTQQLPISEQQLKVLEKIGKSSGKITPSQITVVKAGEREAILASLGERGLIAVEQRLKKTKAEVWLTARGQEYLRNEYTAKGAHPVISLDLLSNYLRFLRKSPELQKSVNQEDSPIPSKLSEAEILQMIRDLDEELGTENYLPIFHLRQKLQPPLSREDLDQALYRLEGSGQIELSALVEAGRYSPEQVDAGIPQRAGSRLFFIKVTIK